MTLSDILHTLTRRNRTLARIERIIEVGATIILTDGRMGTLDSIDIIQGERRGYVLGDGFAASVTEDDIFIYRNA